MVPPLLTSRRRKFRLYTLPVQQYENPTNEGSLFCVEVETGEHETHPSNFRAAAASVVTDEWWFGFEQEYFLTNLMEQSSVGKMELLLGHKENTTVQSERPMSKEEK